MKTFRKLLAMVMAVVMVMLVTVSAAAGSTDTYTITVNGDKTGHTYEAYQIFAGEVDSTGKTLSDITWGAGVNSSALLDALKNDTTYGSLFTSCTEAADVARVLAGDQSSDELVKQFAQLASEHLTTVAGTSTETSNCVYEIKVTGSGYYLIKDKDNTVGNDDAYTDIILEVVADVNVTAKAEYPSASKTVDEIDANIGDTVTYTITGSIPDVSAYTTYTYIFHDTLSSGLDYNDDMVVTLYTGTLGSVLGSFTTGTDYYTLVDGKLAEVTDTTGTPDANTLYYTETRDLDSTTTEYTLTKGTDTDGNTTLDVTINGAKSYSQSCLVITYTADLNEKAVKGGSGNDNKVYIEYTNNPNTGENGKTNEQKVVTFTFELDVTKVDGTDNAKVLEGAQFILYKEDGSDTYYATATVDNGVYTITGWTDEDNTGTSNPATTFESTSAGTFNIVGLDQGTYYLKEVKAPDGYNTLDNPITIIITAEYEDTDGDGIEDSIKTLTATADTKDLTTDKDSGKITSQVENNAGSKMPSTGGIGVGVFFVGGVALIVVALGALTVLKLRGKKTN
ncbi:MAG: isopeptide-forming domain-containing fimbrial protein [Oscillospiraceae bacterium]|nr:isopeptide-forming domain-containing fimbrial protein [Oscillospiraceae bacterium]